jgi:integrase
MWVAELVMPNGKPKRKYSKFQKVVKDWLHDQREAIRDHRWIDNEATTFGDFLARYVRDVASHTLRPKTLQNYESLIRLHIKPELGTIKLGKLRPEHLQSFYTRKLEGGLSRGYVRGIHAIIHKCLDQAVKWGLANRNVSDLTSPPTSPKTVATNVWTVDEARRFLASVKDHPYYPLYLLAISMGMREGELLGLHWEDINWETKTIHVSHAAQTLRGRGVVLTEPKTERGKRTIPIPAMVLDELRERKNGNKGLIFHTKSGKPINARHLVRHFRIANDAAGVPVIRFHDLRHTCATLLLSQNVHPKVVQEILGHSQIRLTLDTYSHVIPSMQSDAADKMNGLLGIP